MSNASWDEFCNFALQFIPTTFGELLSNTNPTVFSSVLCSFVANLHPTTKSFPVSGWLQVHILAPTPLPGASLSQAAQHSLTFLGEQQSGAQCSQECVFIPDPPPTVKGSAPSHSGEFGGQKGCRMGQGFSPSSKCWSTAGLQDCSTKVWPIVLHSSTTWGSSQLSQQGMLGYSLPGIPQGDFSEGWFTEV